MIHKVSNGGGVCKGFIMYVFTRTCRYEQGSGTHMMIIFINETFELVSVGTGCILKGTL